MMNVALSRFMVVSLLHLARHSTGQHAELSFFSTSTLPPDELHFIFCPANCRKRRHRSYLLFYQGRFVTVFCRSLLTRSLFSNILNYQKKHRKRSAGHRPAWSFSYRVFHLDDTAVINGLVRLILNLHTLNLIGIFLNTTTIDSLK